ncbi:hypothetical protein KWG61_01285 [Allobaculum sp. Allo2]|nr:hypothetical protein KWG61_01285 [Allobaculum sp. Allo2]
MWHEAKVQSDYERFRPALEKVISYTLQAASYSPRFDPAHPYDYLLSLYEPGMNQEKYDAFLKRSSKISVRSSKKRLRPGQKIFLFCTRR